MVTLKISVLILAALNLFIGGGNGDDNPFRHVETLDRAGSYNLEWEVQWDTRRVVFTATAKTTGWVGFGLSKKGRMDGADLVMGGVDANGKSYFYDMHGVGNTTPVVDDKQNWVLHSARESDNTTTLVFSRDFDTCDDQDLAITDDLSKLMWAFGENDNTSIYHFQHRGWYDAYLLDPDLAPRSTEAIKNGTSNGDIKVFTLRKEIVLRPQETQYWCTFHKVPLAPGRKHAVGFNTTFPNDLSKKHVHHILLHRCRAPPGVSADEFFGPAVNSEGSECYILDVPNPLPVPYCREVIYMYGVNLKPIFFPQHAGLPIDTTLGQDEYFMFQAHYDNPNSEEVPVTIDLDTYYTEKLREYDAGILQMGVLQPGSTTIVIPPNSLDHSSYGHCAGGCTQRMFPRDGINIFAIVLHTHISGVAARAMHLRGKKELPWISKDDNYNFDFQQFRTLREEVKVMPGDQIVIRCTYDISGRNGSTLYGGFSTREEMCTSFSYYYSHSPGFALCRGEIRTEEYNYGLLGIRNYTWNQQIRRMVITDPPELYNVTVGDHLNNNINWNLEMRERLAYEQRYQTYTSQCPRFYYEDPTTQLRTQLESGILDRTGRLPGSDGKIFTSVDEDFEHLSAIPKDLVEYRPPPRSCPTPMPRRTNN